MGGFAITLVGHPFDTMKVRLQTQPRDAPLYTGLVDCMRKTLQWEGPGGFYRGVSSPLIGNTFFNAVQFLTYGQAKTLFHPTGSDDAISTAQFFAIGAMTGTMVSFVESPIDLFKSQLQVQVFRARAQGQEPEFKTLSQVVRSVVSRYGLRGFYQGLAPTMCRDIPAVSLYFGTYELSRKLMVEPGQSVSELPSHKLLMAGGVGGFCYWLLTYPVDVVKSQLQTDSIDPSKRRYKGMMDCARQLYKEGGAARFSIGFIPCMLRSVPGNAACFFAYEKTRQMLG
eukprot:CAMPEP_0196781954 /NCGR_PEP_ID=MMETSP1104-20130614/10456_1 /TAXON_ID=33652 /ORGANISM="Cafeteria sp., Strain Caron Lab Isolate" /LENGTH=282 /DNA_ID=CAMNT_0042152185 /DNA_START=23 /DNA_END=871 /DNA_ORIENTATION=+